jgi:hypothetical protein
VPVATNASATLWSGHNDRADGGPMYQSPAELARNEAIDWAVSHPLRELELTPLKLNALAHGDSEVVSTWIEASGQRPLGGHLAALASGLGDFSSYALIAALLTTVALSWRRLWRVPAARGVLVFLAAAVPLYGFVYYGNVRYRIPLEPLMLLVVAPAAARVWERRESMRAEGL